MLLSSKVDWGFYVASTVKSASKKIGALIRWSFIHLRLLFISLNLPYGLGWNNLAISGPVFLTTTWIYWINYRNGYVGLLILHLQLLLKLWLIVKMKLSRAFLKVLLSYVLTWTFWTSSTSLFSWRGPLIFRVGCMIFLSTFPNAIKMSMSTFCFLAQQDSKTISLLNTYVWPKI